MSAFYTNEAMFDLLDDGRFADRTVTYLAGSSPNGVDIVLLIERRPLPKEKRLADVVADHGREAMKRFRGYRLLSEQEVEVASLPAIDVRARWRADTGEPIYTRRVHLAHYPPDARPTWLIFTCEAPFEESESADKHLEHALATIRFRDATS